MDVYVDSCCREWSDYALGGLPGARLRCTLDSSVFDVPDGNWPAHVVATERAVAALSDPWRRVVKLQYLNRALTKFQRAGKLGVSVRKYYALLDEAHVIIARELAAGEAGDSGVA